MFVGLGLGILIPSRSDESPYFGGSDVRLVGK